jgi:hypothetical protein
MGIDAATARQSYAPGQVGRVTVSTDEPRISMQILKTGPEQLITYSDQILEGVTVTPATILDWQRFRNAPHDLTFRVGADWPSGLYFVKFAAADATLGYAPFVVRPAALGVASRVAVILPTNTWQAYNFWDANGNGWGDTWYAGYPNRTVVRNRPYLHRGVPPFFYRYDQGFLHWLYWNDHTVDFLAESDLDGVSGDDLARTYDLIVYPGHSEYVTAHEFDVVERYRDLGGNLLFLSANNFFWKVVRRGPYLTRVAEWRRVGRPEAQLVGIQFDAGDYGGTQGPYEVTGATTEPWAFAGTGLADGSTFGRYGFEIDKRAPSSPRGIQVLARIANLMGPGRSAEMTYYETPHGAKVFAAGALNFAASADDPVVSRLLENVWARLSRP